MFHLVQQVASDMLATFFPCQCAVCRTPVDGNRWLCQTCDQEMTEFEERPACPKCAAPIAQQNMPCQRCLGHGLRPFKSIVHGGLHEDPARHLIHKIKYHSHWGYAERLVDRAFAYEAVDELLKATDVLIPVPLHPIKHIFRGYNQAQVIAQRLSKHSGKPVADAAIRIINTTTQTQQNSRKARQDNLRNAFACHKPKVVQGKHITLVDDVITTGATLRALAKAFLPHKPASISAFVLVSADHSNQGFSMTAIPDP